MLNLGRKLCLWRKLEHVVMKVTLIPGGGGGGGGTPPPRPPPPPHSDSSDGDDRKIFLGLEILILEYFLGRKLRQVIFRMALF